MQREDALTTARALTKDVTPLRQDCGRTCGGACCRPLAGEDTGMLLFPREETYYADRPGWTLVPTRHGTLIRCEAIAAVTIGR